MFKRKKKKTGCETPTYSRFSIAPEPKKSASKPNPNYVPPASVKKPCLYSTPCGWCTKWDKKCNKKIGGSNDIEPQREKDTTLEYIKSGKGLPPLNTNSAHGLEMRG